MLARPAMRPVRLAKSQLSDVSRRGLARLVGNLFEGQVLQLQTQFGLRHLWFLQAGDPVPMSTSDPTNCVRTLSDTLVWSNESSDGDPRRRTVQQIGQLSDVLNALAVVTGCSEAREMDRLLESYLHHHAAAYGLGRTNAVVELVALWPQQERAAMEDCFQQIPPRERSCQ